MTIVVVALVVGAPGLHALAAARRSCILLLYVLILKAEKMPTWTIKNQLCICAFVIKYKTLCTARNNNTR